MHCVESKDSLKEDDFLSQLAKLHKRDVQCQRMFDEKTP